MEWDVEQQMPLSITLLHPSVEPQLPEPGLSFGLGFCLAGESTSLWLGQSRDGLQA